MSPHDDQELIDAVAQAKEISTGDVLNRFSVQQRKTNLNLSYYIGIVDFSPDDQVVTVRSGGKFEQLQKHLAEHGQCIPHRFPLKFNVGDAEIGNLIDFNLPHAIEGQCGTWRDWILGMRVVLADGTVCTTGSHAVKNVAGYDAQKLFIGARGTLGIISHVTLRTFPLRALPTRESEYGPASGNHPIYIQRTFLSRLQARIDEAGDRLMSADPLTGTLTAAIAPGEWLTREPGDWVLRSGCGLDNLQITDPTQIRLMTRAKEIFDPSHKLNPGEMGIF